MTQQMGWTMRLASMVAAAIVILLVSGCVPATSNLQESEKAVPDQSICPGGTTLKSRGGGAYECVP